MSGITPIVYSNSVAGGYGERIVQSRRLERYADALERLRAGAGLRGAAAGVGGAYDGSWTARVSAAISSFFP